MAHLPRVPKPVHQWTSDDLESYNIKLEYQDASRFFELGPNEQLPEPEVREPEILTARDAWGTTKTIRIPSSVFLRVQMGIL